jgi:hypothetical protein
VDPFREWVHASIVTTGSTYRSLEAPPAGLDVAVAALAEIAELASRECRECRKIAAGDVVFDTRAEHRTNCAGYVAHRALSAILGRRPKGSLPSP